MSRKSPGEGTIYQRSDGRWTASLQQDGRRVYIYGKTKAETAAKLKELRRKTTVEGGLASNATLKELLDKWVETEQAKWKPLYRRDVRYFVDDVIAPVLGNVRLGKLTPDRIQSFYGKLAKKSTEKAAHCHRILRRGLRVGVQWGLLPVNPLDRVTPPAHRPAPPVLWTSEQIRGFLRSVQDDWLGPFYTTALHTGCRPGELLGLHWSDLAEGSLRIERTLQRVGGEVIEVSPKSAAGRRTLAVSATLAGAFRRQRVQQAEWKLRAGEAWVDSGHIFTSHLGTALSASTANHHLHLLADRLGLPRIGLHKMRHLSASLALQSGVPLTLVSRRLGHSSVAITTSIYSHALTGDEQASELLAKALS